MNDIWVVIVARDCNGTTYKISELWSEMTKYLNAMDVDDEEHEILAVVADGACLYSSLLATESITWQELAGFFA